MNKTNNWTASYKDIPLGIFYSTEAKVWKKLGAQDESGRELLRSLGYNVTEVIAADEKITDTAS